MMRLTAFYQDAVTTVEEVISNADARLKEAGLHCRVIAGEAAHTREGHSELSVQVWAGRDLVDFIEFTPDISYPAGGDTKELGEWFERELDEAIDSNRTHGP
jgi:hypothetical protein